MCDDCFKNNHCCNGVYFHSSPAEIKSDFLRRLKQRKAFKSKEECKNKLGTRAPRVNLSQSRRISGGEAYLTWASDKWQAARRWEDPIDHCLKMIAFRLEAILPNEAPSQLQQWVENLLKCKGDIMIGLVGRQRRVRHHLKRVTLDDGMNAALTWIKFIFLRFKYVTYF